MRRLIGILFLSVVSSFVLFVNSSVLRDKLFPLDIIHYNDFHDRFEETSISYPVCQTNDTNCLGGFARLFHEVKALRNEKPDALLLNAGDAFQGTYWYTLLKWNVTQHFLNMLPHDAHTIGNHEFDNGIEGLAPFLAALQAPVVVANIDTSKEPSLNGLYTPRIVLERKGRKIGIIGVTTPSSATLSRPRNVLFLDPVSVVKDEAMSLSKDGVDIVVVLSHCSLEVDKKIAEESGENVDIIVGGHSHSLLWNGPSPSKEDVLGPYPLVIESKSKPGHKVLIVQASAYTKYLGNITAYFDKQGDLVSFDAQPIFLNRSIPEDLEIKALLRPYAEKLHSITNEVIGYSNDDFLAKSCSYKECALGNLMADAMVNATKESFPSDLPNVGFIMLRMLRGSLSKGEITRGGVMNLEPYANQVVSVVTAGRQVLEALNLCLSVGKKDPSFRSLRMPQISGMQVVVNSTTGTVASVFVDHEGGRRPLEMDKEYQVSLLEFIYEGGLGFNMFKNSSRDFQVVGKDTELIERYIKILTPLNEFLDNRLVIVD